MPVCIIYTNCSTATNDTQTAVIQDVEEAISEVLKKPKQYIMVGISVMSMMRFNSDNSPAAFCDLHSIGGITPSNNQKLSKRICSTLKKGFGIDPARVFIQFFNSDPENFGFDSNDGSTSTFIRYAAGVCWAAGIMAAGVIALLWYFEEKLLFHPGEPPGFKTPDKNPSGLRHPGEAEMDFEDVKLVTEDNIELHAWLIKQPGDSFKSAPTVLFFQGNAGNMGFRIPNISYLVRAAKVNVFALSYRGYGWSQGSPTELGVYKDADAALTYVYNHPHIDKSKIFAFGRSIGGAVAIDLAVRRQTLLRGLIVENTFTNLYEMADLLFPLFRPIRPLIRLIQRQVMDNKRKVPLIKIPTLFISGLMDALVPPKHMQDLFQASGSETKHLYTILMGTHNETWHQGKTEYFEVFLNFINRALQIHLTETSLPSQTSSMKQTELNYMSSVLERTKPLNIS